jgi:predicted nucleic acid-binding protein
MAQKQSTSKSRKPKTSQSKLTMAQFKAMQKQSNRDYKMKKKNAKHKRAMDIMEKSQKTQMISMGNQAIAQGFTSLNRKIDASAQAAILAQSNLEDAVKQDTVQDSSDPWGW